MSELRHFTEEEIEEKLQQALSITERLAPPDDLRPHVFNVAASRLLEKTIMHGAPPLITAQGRIQ